MERGLTKAKIIETMTLSPHGDLSAYLPICGEAAKVDPEFTAHFTAYLAENCQIRDVQAALPIICLAERKFNDDALLDNALAHLAKLSPRELVQAYKFGKFGYIRNKEVVGETVTSPKTGRSMTVKKRKGGWKPTPMAGRLQSAERVNALDRLVNRYLRSREANNHWFDRSVIQFRSAMRELYFLSHTKPSDRAKGILYNGFKPVGSSLEALANLPNMSTVEAAAAIIEFKLPVLSIQAVLGGKVKNPLILMAMIDRMSPSELQTNVKLLEKLGMKDFPETRAAFEKALVKLSDSTKKTTLKTTKAAAAVKDDGLRQKLQGAQERQLKAAKGIDGDWAVFGDKSPSMEHALEAAKMVAGILTKMVRGKVYLIFFDTAPLYFDVTGKSYEEVMALTRLVMIGGGTSIGCGMQYLLDRKLTVDGIAIVSDAAENTSPRFAERYNRYVEVNGNEPTVYLYRLQGSMRAALDIDLAVSMEKENLALTEFDLRKGFDEYSLLEICKTMRVGRYSLSDQIMESRLLTVDEVLKDNKKGDLVTV